MAATRITAHQIRLHPTPEQEAYLRRAAGTRRFVYNWGLAAWNQQYTEYKAGKREQKPTANALKKHFQAIRETDYPQSPGTAWSAPSRSAAYNRPQSAPPQSNHWQYPRQTKTGRLE